MRLLPLSLLLAACGGSVADVATTPSNAPPATTAPLGNQPGEPAKNADPVVLARVNGVDLTNDDLKLVLAAAGHVPGDNPAGAALDTLVRTELRAQKSKELGLGLGPEGLAKVRRAEAQLAAARREAMADALVLHETNKRGPPTEEEVRAEYDKNAALYRTDFHIMQILRRLPSEAEADLARLAAGEPFEVVARARFPGLPASAGTPWDLGWLGWHQFPPTWQGAVDTLAPGQHSGILAGPGGRYWIVQVLERRERSNGSFEALRAAISSRLVANRGDSWRETLDSELRAAAKVERTDAPLPAPMGAVKPPRPPGLPGAPPAGHPDGGMVLPQGHPAPGTAPSPH
jgi:hypothetical protein